MYKASTYNDVLSFTESVFGSELDAYLGKSELLENFNDCSERAKSLSDFADMLMTM